MNQKPDVYSRLKNHWASFNISSKGNDPASLQSFQQEHKISLPNDFIDYFLTVNGISDLVGLPAEENGFRFLALDELPEQIPHLSKLYSVKDTSTGLFIFVDYMQYSWAYACLYSKDNPDQYLLGVPEEDTFVVITDSLHEFLELYFVDDARLYDLTKARKIDKVIDMLCK